MSSAEFHIRPYEERDWPRLCEIHDASRADELEGSVSLEVFRPLEEVAGQEGLLSSPVWVAEETSGGKVVGFVAASDDELGWLYVDPGHYRRGVGRALVRHITSAVSSPIKLTVLSNNKPAIALYESEGFRISNRIPLRFKEGGHTAEGMVLVYDPGAEEASSLP